MNVSGNTSTSYILDLARSFPALERKLNHYHPDRFDADEFHAMTRGWSTGERHLAMFILNVWNPGYAESKGWNFDFIAFVAMADGENKEALAGWLQHPYFP
jgi:hypothetical protein